MNRYVPALLPVVMSLFAQHTLAQTPTSLSVAPGTVYRPPSASPCYTLTVGNGANMVLDIKYTLNSGPEQEILSWPSLNAAGQVYICTDDLTVPGLYRFTGVRRTQSGAAYLPVNAPLTVMPPPSQPTSLTFNGAFSSSGWAGYSSYTIHADGAASQSIDLEYFIGSEQGVVTVALDVGGNAVRVLQHHDREGAWRFTRMKNSHRDDWIDLDTLGGDRVYTVLPPRPRSASIAPASVVAGQGSYTLSVGNGADVTLDLRYTLDNVAQPDIFNWPALDPVAPGSGDGSAVIAVGPCTKLGTYRFTQIENHRTPGVWEVLSNAPAVTITRPAAPAVSSRIPIAAAAATSGALVINGANLCGVQLSTTYPGLTFDAIPDDGASSGTSVIGGYTISPTAVAGTATVTLTARGGTTTFQFSVGGSQLPSITGFMPSSLAAGSSATVTVAGANLIGGTLSSSSPALLFADLNYASNGSSLTARFTVVQGTEAGNTVVTVTTPAGSASRAFAITAGGAAISSIREYIYLGPRLLAVENMSSAQQPPGAPSPLTGRALNENTVELTWPPSAPTRPEQSITAYQVKRGNTVLATLPPSQLSFLDTSAQQNTTYTFTTIAQDNGAPAQLASSNAVTVRTPLERTPPTAPSNVTSTDGGDWWVTLTWNPSTDSGGSGLAGYFVRLAGFDVPLTELIPAPQNSATVNLSALEGLDWNTFNGFAVYAVDNAGNWSAPGYWP